MLRPPNLLTVMMKFPRFPPRSALVSCDSDREILILRSLDLFCCLSSTSQLIVAAATYMGLCNMASGQNVEYLCTLKVKGYHLKHIVSIVDVFQWESYQHTHTPCCSVCRSQSRTGPSVELGTAIVKTKPLLQPESC
jgi:hypothetical protein